MNKKKRGAIEISFGWLFAIIAGAFILFLAIYFSTRLINTQKAETSAETGTEIGILLNPLETSFESGQTTSITIPAETRINNRCENFSGFGRQVIQLDQKSFSKWTKTNIDIGFENKYIFSNDEIEGRKFYIFSKPFSFPFKVADLIYMTSANDIYCFIDAPYEINEELFNLNQSNMLIENCPEGSIKICFNNMDCEINVDYVNNRVEKNREYMYFAGDITLMYAAIFSNSEIYECELKRLMERTKEISLLYAGKELITEKKGCDSNLGGELSEFSDLISALTSSGDLGIVKIKADDINEKNRGRICLLW